MRAFKLQSLYAFASKHPSSTSASEVKAMMTSHEEVIQ
jgi:hypothetical protein